MMSEYQTASWWYLYSCGCLFLLTWQLPKRYSYREGQNNLILYDESSPQRSLKGSQAKTMLNDQYILWGELCGCHGPVTYKGNGKSTQEIDRTCKNNLVARRNVHQSPELSQVLWKNRPPLSVEFTWDPSRGPWSSLFVQRYQLRRRVPLGCHCQSQIKNEWRTFKSPATTSTAKTQMFKVISIT